MYVKHAEICAAATVSNTEREGDNVHAHQAKRCRQTYNEYTSLCAHKTHYHLTTTALTKTKTPAPENNYASFLFRWILVGWNHSTAQSAWPIPKRIWKWSWHILNNCSEKARKSFITEAMPPRENVCICGDLWPPNDDTHLQRFQRTEYEHMFHAEIAIILMGKNRRSTQNPQNHPKLENRSMASVTSEKKSPMQTHRYHASNAVAVFEHTDRHMDAFESAHAGGRSRALTHTLDERSDSFATSYL